MERTTFQEEQARRRRGTWRLSLACMAIAATTGLVLSTVLTPILLCLAGLVLRIAGLVPGVGRLLEPVRDTLARWIKGRFDDLGALVDALSAIPDLWHVGSAWPAFARLAPVFLPGMLLAASIWLICARAERGTGMSGLALSLGARPPRADDIEERQICNLADEMALAAGLPAPKVLLVDSQAVNAAVIGSGPGDATLLVTRGLLDKTDRDQAGGAIAHLTAFVGNGDLAVSASVLAVFQTLAIVLSVLDLPFRASPWRGFAALAPMAIGLSRDPSRLLAADRHFATSMSSSASDELGRFVPNESMPLVKKILLFPLLPLILLTLFFKMIMILWVPMFLGPPLALLFRNRRYLADACAVQLNRDPAAMGQALTAIARSGGLPDGAASRDFLFIHAPGLGTKDGLMGRGNVPASLCPPLDKRLARLGALGGDAVTVRPLIPWDAIRGRPAISLLVGGLLLLLVPLVGLLAVLTIYVTLGVMFFALAGGLAVASLIVG